MIRGMSPEAIVNFQADSNNTASICNKGFDAPVPDTWPCEEPDEDFDEIHEFPKCFGLHVKTGSMPDCCEVCLFFKICLLKSKQEAI